MEFPLRAAIIAFATLAWVACDQAPGPSANPAASSDGAEPGVIADIGEPFMKVDGFQVGRREIDQVFRNRGVPEAMLDSVVTSPGGYHILEDYALATALYRKAVEEGLHEDPQVQLELAFAERQALSRIMQKTLAERRLTDERVANWIEKNADQFSLPQKQAREIVVGSEAYARELMERLEGGEDFADLARDHSLDARSAKNGGFVGWFSFQDRPELGQAIFAHGSSAVLGPLESKAGWHIVEILDARDSTPPEERELIARAALEQKAAQEATKEIRDALDVELQFAGVDGDPHLPEGHPPAEGEGATEAPADAGEDASSEEAKE